MRISQVPLLTEGLRSQSIPVDGDAMLEAVRVALAIWAALVVVLPVAGMLVALIVFLSAARLSATAWKAARGRRVIVPQYSVSPDLDLLVAGALVGKSGNVVAAQIISLAVRGFIRVADTPTTRRTATDDRFFLELVHTEGIDRTGWRFVQILFGSDPQPGSRWAVSEADVTTGIRFGMELHSVDAEMVRRRLRITRGQVAQFCFVVAGVAVCIMAVTLLLAFGSVTAFGFLVAAATVAIGLATMQVAKHDSTLTVAGMDQRDHLLGVRDYLLVAEADRFRMMQSPDGAERRSLDDGAQILHLHEDLLPYAVLFGIEDQWSRELAAVGGLAAITRANSASAPDPAFLVATIAAAAAHATMSSTPPQRSWQK